MSGDSGYEWGFRERKAFRLAAALERAIRRYAPEPSSVDPVRVLERFGDDSWEALRISANVKPPSDSKYRDMGVSPETRARVLQIFTDSFEGGAPEESRDSEGG